MDKKPVIALVLLVVVIVLMVKIPIRRFAVISIDKIDWYPSTIDDPATAEIEGGYWVIFMTVDYTTLSGLKFSKDGITTSTGEKYSLPIPEGVSVVGTLKIEINPKKPYYTIPLVRTPHMLTNDKTYTSVQAYDAYFCYYEYFEDTEEAFGKSIPNIYFETLDYPPSPTVYTHTPFEVKLEKVGVYSQTYFIDTEGTNTTYRLQTADPKEYIKLVSLGWLKAQRSDPTPKWFSAFQLPGTDKAVAYEQSDTLSNVLQYDKIPQSFSYYWFGDKRWSDSGRPMAYDVWTGASLTKPGWSDEHYGPGPMKQYYWKEPIAPTQSQLISYLNQLVADGYIKAYDMDYYKEGYSVQDNTWTIETSYTSSQAVTLWISTEIVDAIYVTTPIPKAEIVSVSPQTSPTNRATITDQMTVTLGIKNVGTAKGQFDVFGEATPKGYTEIYSPQSPIIEAGQTLNLNFTIKNLGPTVYTDVDVTFYVKSHETGEIQSHATIYVRLMPTAQLGTLLVWTEGESPPNTGKIYVDGVEVQRNFGNMYKKDYAAGTSLKVSFGDIAGYETPKPQTVTIVAGQTISVKGVYVGTATVTLRVYARKAGTTETISGITINIRLVNGTAQTSTTGVNGYCDFALGQYTGAVQIWTEQPLTSPYLSNSTIIESLNRGTNTVYLDLPPNMAPQYITIGVIAVIVAIIAIAVWRRRRA